MKNVRNALVLSLVLLSVVSMGSVAGTYAKYTSNATSTDSARVAKWSFKVGTTDIATSSTFTFNLFETVDSNVKAGEAENIIAPGTEGSFTISLENNSEVNATYAIDYTVTNTANIPVEFSIDNGTTWTTTLEDVTDTDINMSGATDSITIKWRWAFEGTSSSNYTVSQTDLTDTALGVTGTDTITVTANITATQKN